MDEHARRVPPQVRPPPRRRYAAPSLLPPGVMTAAEYWRLFHRQPKHLQARSRFPGNARVARSRHQPNGVRGLLGTGVHRTRGVDPLRAQEVVTAAPVRATQNRALQELFRPDGRDQESRVRRGVALETSRMPANVRQSWEYPSRTREGSLFRLYRQHDSPICSVFFNHSDGLEPSTPPYHGSSGASHAEVAVAARVYGVRSARSTARATSTRDATPSLRNVLRRWVSTVFELRKSSAAICGLVLRSTTSRAIWSSRSVSESTPDPSALPGRVRRWIERPSFRSSRSACSR